MNPKLAALLKIAAVVVGVFLIGALLVPVLSRSDSGVTELTGATVRAVEVSTDRGGVVVRAGTPRVEQKRTWILSAPEVRSRVEDGTLRVRVSCPGWAFVSCSADVVVQAPAAADVSVDATKGTVAVTGMSGAVNARSEDGSVRVEGTSTTVTARSVTKSVTVVLSGPVPDEVAARSETGAVSVTVPRGTYRVVAQSVEAATRVEGVTRAPEATANITAHSGIGDVTVTGR